MPPLGGSGNGAERRLPAPGRAGRHPEHLAAGKCHASLRPWPIRAAGGGYAQDEPRAGAALPDAALALLGIVTELPSRYYPEQLAVNVGGDRTGLAGWIVDRVLGRDADVDESLAKDEIAGLRRLGLIRITPTRRLEATEYGESVWQQQGV